MEKGKTLPFPLSNTAAKACFDLVHTDVWVLSPFSQDMDTDT